MNITKAYQFQEHSRGNHITLTIDCTSISIVLVWRFQFVSWGTSDSAFLNMICKWNIKKQIKGMTISTFLVSKKVPQKQKLYKLFIGIYLNRKKCWRERSVYGENGIILFFKDVFVSKFNWSFYSMDKRLNSWFRANQN